MPRVKKIRSRNINSKTKSKSRKSKSKKSKKIRLRRSSGGTITITICNINIEVKYYSFNYGDFFLPYIIQEPDPNKYSVDITIKDEIYIRKTLYKEHNKEISNRRYNLSIKTETEKNQYLDLVDEVKDMINKLKPPDFKEIKACKDIDIDIFFDSLIERGNIMRLLYLIHYVFPERIDYVLKFDKKIPGTSYLVVEPVKIFFKYFYKELTPEKIKSIFTF